MPPKLEYLVSTITQGGEVRALPNFELRTAKVLYRSKISENPKPLS